MGDLPQEPRRKHLGLRLRPQLRHLLPAGLCLLHRPPRIETSRPCGRHQEPHAGVDGTTPKVLVRDRDDKFGSTFDRVAEGTGIRVIKIAVRAPNMNAAAERFVGSVRREMLDHVLLLDDRHLDSLARQYLAYFNDARPHQGIEQMVPANRALKIDTSKPIEVTPVLGGLHADYRRAA